MKGIFVFFVSFEQTKNRDNTNNDQTRVFFFRSERVEAVVLLQTAVVFQSRQLQGTHALLPGHSLRANALATGAAAPATMAAAAADALATHSESSVPQCSLLRLTFSVYLLPGPVWTVPASSGLGSSGRRSRSVLLRDAVDGSCDE